MSTTEVLETGTSRKTKHLSGNTSESSAHQSKKASDIEESDINTKEALERDTSWKRKRSTLQHTETQAESQRYHSSSRSRTPIKRRHPPYHHPEYSVSSSASSSHLPSSSTTSPSIHCERPPLSSRRRQCTHSSFAEPSVTFICTDSKVTKINVYMFTAI